MINEELNRLALLEDNWDDDDSPAPLLKTLEDADKIITDSEKIGLEPFEIDADVMGGVGLYYSNKNDKRVWICLLNNEDTAVVFYNHMLTEMSSFMYDEESLRRIKTWLGPDLEEILGHLPEEPESMVEAEFSSELIEKIAEED